MLWPVNFHQGDILLLFSGPSIFTTVHFQNYSLEKTGEHSLLNLQLCSAFKKWYFVLSSLSIKFWYFTENPNFSSIIFWRLSNNFLKIHDSALTVGGRVFFGFLVVDRVVIAVVVTADVFFVVSSGHVSAWSEQQSRKSWQDESQKQSWPFILAPIFDSGWFQSWIRQIHVLFG